MVQLPAHTTHRLQPLDVAFFKPLNTYFGQAADKWMRSNPGDKITQYQVAQLVGEAYGKTCTIETAISCLKSTGIWPLDKNVFKDHEFAAAVALAEPNSASTTEITAACTSNGSTSPDASPSSAEYKKMVQELSPVPKMKTKGGITTKPKVSLSSAEEITSSPFKKRLENSLQRKEGKEKRVRPQEKVWWCFI